MQGLRIKNREEWGVKAILDKDVDDGGETIFLVDWDGNWQPTWEPPDVLENSQDKIDAFLAAQNAPKKNSRGRKRKRGDD